MTVPSIDGIPDPMGTWRPYPRLTIDLNALSQNWRVLTSFMGGAEVGATIKADAYGLGAEPVGTALARTGCRTFFVANAKEGAALRDRLSKVFPPVSIYVYDGPTPGELDLFESHQLRPVLNAYWQLDLWRAFTRSRNAAPAAVHVDTGMNRLGFQTGDVEALGHQIADLNIALVLSHLACADEPDHPLNAAQLGRFRTVWTALKTYTPDARASLANSAGCGLGPDYAFDLVRPGIALYGAHAGPNDPEGLQQVVTLDAPVLQVMTLKAGDSVGYGGSIVERDTLAVTIAAGYADGVLRASGPKGFGGLAGHRIPILGRVSMDLITLDATECADAARPGARVTLFGGVQSLEGAAARAGTLNYELLTRLGPRCERVYLD